MTRVAPLVPSPESASLAAVREEETLLQSLSLRMEKLEKTMECGSAPKQVGRRSHGLDELEGIIQVSSLLVLSAVSWVTMQEVVRLVVHAGSRKTNSTKNQVCEGVQTMVQLNSTCSYSVCKPCYFTLCVSHCDRNSTISAQEVQRFLGLVGYYRRYVQDFSTIAKPLSAD